jgi:hypothetical protein
MILAFLLPSTLLARETAAAPVQLQRLEAFGAGPQCTAASLLPGQVPGSPVLMADYEVIGDLCSGLCTISCLAQGYFGGYCVGLACHCNGAEQQQQQQQ